ncbi:MAG: uracil-DNA glycosylase [Tenericutes bacterium]|nr:uracil-DNA glycosylase [Mycoplasmatota bacterium]
MNYKVNNNWDIILKDEYEKEYFKNLLNYINEEYNNKTVYPLKENIFKALEYTDYNDIKVVILGQDPYHGEGEAQGLSFSIPNDIKITPSLRNIFKELKNDLNIERTNTDLSDWAKQGILLLNAILTVCKDTPLSHKDKGWEIFTDEIIKKINEREDPVIFILWGNYARSKKKLITNKNHYIIESAHPSPLSASRGFFDSKPFSKTNNILNSINKESIRW